LLDSSHINAITAAHYSKRSRENTHIPSERLCERIRAAIMAAADYLELTLRQVEGMARQICRLRDSRRTP
jgi:hypothetical protein